MQAFPLLRELGPSGFVAFKATPLDATGERMEIGTTRLNPMVTLASLGIAAGDQFVFKARAVAAATGGAAASIGE